jgi:hypothetical protein
MTKDSAKKPEKKEIAPEDMEARMIMRQMREEARQEKVKLFLTQYKKHILYSLLLFAIISVSVVYYYARQQDKNEKYSKLIHQALVYKNQNKLKEMTTILEGFKVDESIPSHLKSLALLKYGSTLASQNKTLEAKNIYLQVNKLRAIDPYIKELSGLLALKTMIDSDNKEFHKEIKSLLPRLEKRSSILKLFILEQKAIFEWSIGNNKKAQEILENLIIDLEAPNYLKVRASELSKIVK